MTGFARIEGEEESFSWVWEAKSVNGRGLDIRNRVPPGFDRYDPKIREAMRSVFARGSVSITLTVTQTHGAAGYVINEEMLRSVKESIPILREAFPDAAPVSLDGILAMRGIFESNDASIQLDEDAMDIVLTKGLKNVVEELTAERAKEGQKLSDILSERLIEMRDLVAKANASAAVRPEAIRARFEENVSVFVGDRPGVSEERLAQEVALLASKADIREELDRLAAHIDQAAHLLDNGGAMGRKLDFLAQEFNRETNTLCAKAGDIELGRIGLALKTIVDQFKEQVQNVE